MYDSDLYIKAMTWGKPETIPVTVLLMPSLWIKYPEEIKKLTAGYPWFFDNPGEPLNYDGWTTYHVGTHTDEWGCVWSNIKEGQESIVTGHPVKTRQDINDLKIPGDRSGRMPHGKIPINLDLDRQYLPFATAQGVDKHIRECVESFYLARGGLGIMLSLNDDVPLPIIEAAVAAVDKYRRFRS
jgi:hypothetical protein